MSGLVNGLQNRLRRFESARHLKAKEDVTITSSFFIVFTVQSENILVIVILLR